jgi:hypothetical protein
MLVATAVVDDTWRGAWLVVAGGLAAWTSGFVRGYHPQAHVGAFVATDYGAAAVAGGTVDLCEGYRASSVAHSDNRE